jgi:NADH-quinone oxidoreductase subunit J
MMLVFLISGVIAVVTAILAVTRASAVHALLLVTVSILAVALIFFILGAPFVAALEVIIYAGAIMVLFIFVVMMLNLGPQSSEQERSWMNLRAWIIPSVMALILIAELVYVLVQGSPGTTGAKVIEPLQISLALFGPYLLGVELASILLLAGLVGAYHLGRGRDKRIEGSV